MEISDKENTNNARYKYYDRLRSFITYFTVEPILFCYNLAMMISSTATNHFNMFKACHVDLNYNKSLCINIADNVRDNITQNVFDLSQKINTSSSIWSTPLQNGFPTLLIFFLASWSDRTGNRKVLILMPLWGELLATFGKILSTYYLSEWPVRVVVAIDTLPTAFSGGISVLIMAVACYITDITTNENRTFKLGVISLVSSVSIPIGMSISGILTKTLGYYGVFSLAFTIYLLGIIYAMLRIKDKIHHKTEENFREKVIHFIHPRNIWNTVSILLNYRRKQILPIILVILAHIVIHGPIAGEGPLAYYYSSKKFQMGLVEYSLFQTYSMVFGLIGSMISLVLFTKIFKIHDALLGMLGTLSNISFTLMMALATTKIMYYCSPVFKLCGDLAGLASKSIGTKLVDQDDVAKFLSIYGLVEAIGPVIYAPLYNKLYEATLDTLPGAYYLVGTVMTVPANFIFIYLYIWQKKIQKDVVENPEEKSKQAYDNAVTSL